MITVPLTSTYCPPGGPPRTFRRHESLSGPPSSPRPPEWTKSASMKWKVNRSLSVPRPSSSVASILEQITESSSYDDVMAAVATPTGRRATIAFSSSSSPPPFYLPLSTQPPLLLHTDSSSSSSSDSEVSEVLSTMKETPPEGASPPEGLIVSSDCLSFEVLYVGKLRMSGRKPPPTFIDEALLKFRSVEDSRRRDSLSTRRSSQESSSDGGGSTENLQKTPTVLVSSSESSIARVVKKEDEGIHHPLQDSLPPPPPPARSRNSSGDSALLVKSVSLPAEPMRNRALSTGHHPRSALESRGSNRTMLLIVGRSEMKIISPDAKTLLFSKHFREVYHYSQGLENRDYFGFICREGAEGGGYVAYVFRSQSESVSHDILKVLRQASAAEAQRREGRVLSCEHCPMLQYRALVEELEGIASEERIQLVILKWVASLGEEEGDKLLAKFGGAEGAASTPEQNQLLLMLLRVHCESKQASHVHDTAENRTEFLSQVLGGGAILLKAKKSFDHFLKRKGGERSPEREFRGRSMTLGAVSDLRGGVRRGSGSLAREQPTMLDVYRGFKKKVGGQESPEKVRKPGGSWRQAIFKKVVTPPNSAAERRISGEDGGRRVLFPRKRSREEIRALWKTAINQQIILIRMEKQNSRLKAKQEEADVKRVKLSYVEIGTCDEEANDTWDLIISQAEASNRIVDTQLLNSAILRGIPKAKRGQVWQFLVEQKRRTLEKDATTSYAHLKMDTSYDDLLRQLTSQQHAILIDLGRTFPSQPYFSGALGSGQLALFNILKAYSLLDTDVGYCQGLSFVAGLLLMHLEEEEAFSVLKFIMFDLKARELYKPDMHELQAKLYQLTRLLHDSEPETLQLLNEFDVLPSLYAAPWFLTLFASTFPSGFCVRVLDVLLLHGIDVIARFALLLIGDARSRLSACSGLEALMDAFKSVLPSLTDAQLDSLLRRALADSPSWERRLLTYSVEYSVMNDEAFGPSKSRVASTQTDDPVHPILGDLIQRQNGEISRLKVERGELRKDVGSLLHAMLTMQKLAVLQGGNPSPLPPEVTAIASKYFEKGSNVNYATLLESAWT